MSFSTTGSVVAGSINVAFNSNTLGSLITTSGNIGIGTTSPAYTLDVNGTVNGNSGLVGSTNGSSAVGNIGESYTNGTGTGPGSSTYTPVASTSPLPKGVYIFTANGTFQQSGSGTGNWYVGTALNTNYNTLLHSQQFIQSQGVGQYTVYMISGVFTITTANTVFNVVAKWTFGGGSSDSGNGLYVTRIA